jgi:hypothetical protein
MTLTAAGNLGLGTTTPTGAAGRAFAINGGAGQTRIALKNSATGDAADDGFQILLDSGGVDVTLEQRENGALRFATNGAVQARIDSSGNFLVGGTSVLQSAKITSYGSVSAQNGGVDGTFANAFVGVYSGNSNEHNAIQTAVSSSGTASGFRFKASLGGGSATTYPVLDLTRDQTIFYAANNERARITSGGDVAIGRTDPPMRLSVAAAGAVISGTATIGSNMQGIQVYNTNSATTNNAVGIWFPTGPHQAGIASFRADAEGGWDTTLAFYTHGAATSQLNDCFERVRITGEGNLLVGTTSPAGGSTNTFIVNATNKTGLTVQNNASTTPRGFVSSFPNGGNDTSSYHLIVATLGADKLYIFGNGNVQNVNNSYGALSDIKLKENIVDATPKLANLMQVKVRNYNLIGDATKQIGVVAQELEAVFPAMIDETTDRDAEGNDLGTTTKSVKYSVFVPMLIKAIQELKAELDSVKSELATIKGAV